MSGNVAILPHSPRSYSYNLIKIELKFEVFLFRISFLIWILQPVWMLKCSKNHKLFGLLLSRWSHSLQHFLSQTVKVVHCLVYLLILCTVSEIFRLLVKLSEKRHLFQKFFPDFDLNFKQVTNFFTHYHRYHFRFNFIIKLNSKFMFLSTFINHTLDDVSKVCKYQLSILNSMYL
jgi:hypothetical protein